MKRDYPGKFSSSLTKKVRKYEGGGEVDKPDPLEDLGSPEKSEDPEPEIADAATGPQLPKRERFNKGSPTPDTSED